MSRCGEKGDDQGTTEGVKAVLDFSKYQYRFVFWSDVTCWRWRSAELCIPTFIIFIFLIHYSRFFLDLHGHILRSSRYLDPGTHRHSFVLPFSHLDYPMVSLKYFPFLIRTLDLRLHHSLFSLFLFLDMTRTMMYSPSCARALVRIESNLTIRSFCMSIRRFKNTGRGYSQ